MMPELPRAYPGLVCRGLFRRHPDDFVVTEQLAEAPSGHGEHSLLEIEKVGQNTAWVARWLARAADVAQKDVGYCGLKDRHARCLQWFSVPRQLDAETLAPPEGVRVLRVHQHHRKLRTGSHAANTFRLRLELEANGEALEERVAAIRAGGCPNWFGQQRFGRDGGNLSRARLWFEKGGRVKRDQRGFMLSAARSELFNQLLAMRVRDGSWNLAMDREILNLDGSGSVFQCETADEVIVARVAAFDVHPTGPLWGKGDAVRDSGTAERERTLLADESALMDGLENAGLRAERRPLRVCPSSLSIEIDDIGHEAWLSFSLRPGQFATAVLQEIGNFNDLSIPA